MMKEYILRIDEYADLNDLSIDDENIVWVNWHYPNGLGESTPEGTIRPYPNPWHTGTPTEKGLYLVCLNSTNLQRREDYIIIEYDLLVQMMCGVINKDNFVYVKAWQKIEPYEEVSK